MFGFIAKMPKLAVIGAVVLLIGFSPEILATVHIDTAGPTILGTYPNGTNASPTPLTPGEAIYLSLSSDSPDINPLEVWCTIDYIVGGSPGQDVERLMSMGGNNYSKSWTVPNAEGLIKFTFQVEDWAGNTTTQVAWGELGDADGDFYLKDGNDPAYINMTGIDIIRFNHNDIYFKFESTNSGWAITRVWIEIDGSAFDLSEIDPDDVWNGTYKTLSDGTYTITGHFTAFGQDWQTMSILIGEGEDPTPPSEWSEYDWLKVLGGALIVVGFIWKK